MNHPATPNPNVDADLKAPVPTLSSALLTIEQREFAQMLGRLLAAQWDGRIKKLEPADRSADRE